MSRDDNETWQRTRLKIADETRHDDKDGLFCTQGSDTADLLSSGCIDTYTKGGF